MDKKVNDKKLKKMAKRLAAQLLEREMTHSRILASVASDEKFSQIEYKRFVLACEAVISELRL